VAEAPVEDGPVGEIVNRYRQFLTAERGLVPVTGLGYVNRLCPFPDRRLSPGGLDPGSLTPADVTFFVVGFFPRLNGGVAKQTITALRSFLGFSACSQPSPRTTARRISGPKRRWPGRPSLLALT